MDFKNLSAEYALPDNLLIIKQACELYGPQFEVLDRAGRELVSVSWQGQRFYVGSGAMPTYPMNTSSVVQICTDKWLTNEVLRSSGFQLPREQPVYFKKGYPTHRRPGFDFLDALNFADKQGYPVFVKPGTGTNGLFAQLAYNKEELFRALDEIRGRYDRAVVQEVLSGVEYRAVCLFGRVIYMYEQRPAEICGDNKSTFLQLLTQHNLKMRSSEFQVDIQSSYLQRQMQEKKISFEDVLSDTQTIKIRCNSNIITGGIPSNFTTTIPKEVEKWCARMADAIGLKICGVDFFAPQGLEKPDSFSIIEINSNPDTTIPFKIGQEHLIHQMWKTIFAYQFKGFE